jgi:cysteinyl-tRNA synthetase
MLKIYNSMTRSKQEFRPLREGKVGIYVCGITVYDYCHLGHARMLVVFDMVVRYLRSLGYEVTYVRNITDIDDKIIKRAHENNESLPDLTRRFIDAMNEDADALGVLKPDYEPRATEHMAEIIHMIEKLVKNGYAYVADNGDVFYDVSRFRDYGKLSGKKLDELRAGERVAVQEAKDDPLDFVLWKAAKEGEPSWESPWGPGRPGWHIECSAMSTHCLGDYFDIHGGGQDLQFPHHENEIAQSCGATGQPFVNVWMHNGFIRIDDEKMSKSLGNFFTVREVLKLYQPEVIRFFLLSSHYRSPLNYSDASLDEAKASLSRLYIALKGITPGSVEPERRYIDDFHKAMDDDFNTRGAVAVLHGIAHELNRITDKHSEQAKKLAATLQFLGGILGILQDSPAQFLQAGGQEGGISDEEILTLIDERLHAREKKDFKEADRIREQLSSRGIVLEDSPTGTTWRRE